MRIFFAALFAVMLVTIVPAAASEHESSGDMAASGATIEVIASGLNNPRGITIAPNGSIYVAESGTGGSILVADEEGGVCIGESGAVTRIRGGVASQVAQFPSYVGAADADGPGPAAPTCDDPSLGIAATGPSGVAVDGDGRLVVTMGLGAPPEVREFVPDEAAELAARFGTLQRINRDGTLETLADLAAFEGTRNPDGDEVDSNPYGVTALDFGRRLVTDAGGNDILEIDAWGGVRRYVSVFPPLAPAPFTPPSCFADLPPEAQAQFPPAGAMIPPQSVPTSVAVGPDGAYYVGLLSGFPFAPGSAAVYRVDPATGSFHPYATGLSHVVGIDFGPDGSLYVVELAQSLLELEVCQAPAPGSLVRVKDGTKTVVLDDLPLPGGVVVDFYGTVYITTNSILPGAGEVWRVTLPE